MIKNVLYVGSVLIFSTAFATAQDDSSQSLDDASSLRQAAGEVLAGDDADKDMAARIDATKAVSGPIAFGVVTANGAKFSGTPNFASSYNASQNRYEIAITGQSYYYLNYATLITPAGDVRFCKSSSVGGKLLVYCYDAQGGKQQAKFGFLTFKP